jgi:hypothetical protein
MKTKLLELANHYLGEARACADALAKQFGTADILNAVHSSKMPREGSIAAFGGRPYVVHGTGCRAETPEGEVDFDFGPNGSIPGFDPWKLYGFARDRRETYPWLPERELFEQEIAKILAEGLLKRSGADPNPQLLSPSRLRAVGIS